MRKIKRAAELIIANKELAFQNDEKEKRAAELIIANKELAFQNDEKEKRAAELKIANVELAFQNEEKEKRAAELSIANKELTFQNDEKEKRAAELIIANKELAFQNDEKEKRAAELIIANKELVFQNDEKEKRAAELIIANKELVFQNEEKDKRAAELSIANTDIKDLGDLNIHKETVLATLSHDLRSPLAGIIGTAEHLKNNFEKLNKEDVKELLELLYKESTNELNMLDYLVEWARIKYASETFLPEKIMLSQYVKKVFDTLNENALAKNISLLNEIKENENVFADGKMLLSILQNLVSNAIKHTLEGGKITITAQKKEDKIIVEVKDTGIGMSKEMREKLFAPQMKALSKARKENKGAGIGLLLVKNFLEKMGGEIWVESEEGKGSSFYFSLPVNKPVDKIESAEKIDLTNA